MSTLTSSQQRTEAGHLSDVALSALADGQDGALSLETHGHLHECEACQMRLADAVLEHAQVAEAFVAVAEVMPTVRTPWAWIATAAAALVVVRGGAWLEGGLGGVQHDAQRTLRGGSLLVRSLLAEASWTLGLSCVVAAVVVVVALARWVAPETEQA